MRYVLDFLYLLTLLLASPWLLVQSLRTGKYREGLAAKFFGFVPVRNSDRPCIWLHAVSVGEVNLLATLIAQISLRHPDCECVVSTTTRAGYQLARRRYSDLTVFNCPLDFSWAVRRAVKRVRPQLLVLAELELWPNLIAEAKRRGAHVAVINGRLSEKSFRGYSRIRWLLGPVLRKLDYIAAQTHEYADRFVALGAPRHKVQVTGSMKFDGAETDRANPRTRRLLELVGIESHDTVLVAGSTQMEEEAIAIACYRQLAGEFPRLRLIIVPRHPERFDQVATALDESGLAWKRRTQLDLKSRNPLTRVLLVDTVGELGAWWGTADIALVGGSFGHRGGQNMIEPAAYGAAVCFGPHTQNFRDVVALLLAEKAAVVVNDLDEFVAFTRRLLEHPAEAEALGARARAVVRTQLGATERTMEGLAALFNDVSSPQASARNAA